MDFRISDTFTSSLARLMLDEQKLVKQTAFDLQMDPMTPGMNFHPLKKCRDKNFSSIRINDDIRLIIHKANSSFLLCYVDHHDKAYDWAERRKLETHPKTGAAQFVEIRELTENRHLPVYVEQPVVAPTKNKLITLLFSNISDEELLGYGVPPEWLDAVRLADEDTILKLTDHLPQEAAEALLELATGGTPKVQSPPKGVAPFDHPDAQRRFRLMSDVDELKQALEFPWDRWTVFLHPVQRQLVERDYSGPARVSGSAGTGKTIVALHRAVHLAKKYPDSRVLLTTFSDTLANALQLRLRKLIGSEPRIAERLEVKSLNSVGERLYGQESSRAVVLPRAKLFEIVSSAASQHNLTKFSTSFLVSEWHDIVDAWQIDSWEGYRDVKRLGRKTRLSETVRQTLWTVFAEVNNKITKAGFITYAALFSKISVNLANRKKRPFDFVVVDESQDISAAQLKFVGALVAEQREGLFFAGDLGQRIFQMPFSWKSVGVDIRGRSRTLSVNYRTSHQIREHADKLLDQEVSDVDGNIESRRGTVSAFNGAVPEVVVCDTQSDEIKVVGQWIESVRAGGVAVQEIGLIVRSTNEIQRAVQAAAAAGVSHQIVDERIPAVLDAVSICVMHVAKGLEFRAVAVMACDDDVIPSQIRISEISDEADLEEVYATERQLLYVAVTRARDFLLISCGGPRSEFLDDFRG
jgi:superfamily I DNA/RNA helicase/plasmid maintenance system killer protein